jgi:hypothetical protein
MSKEQRIRWAFGDLAIVGNVIVGRIFQLPGGSDSPWQACGMMNEWDDTDLGQHKSFVLAKVAVVQWYLRNA